MPITIPRATASVLDEGPILASSGAFLVAFADQALVLYAAAQLRDHWIAQGRRRPLAPGASLLDAAAEARAWLDEYEDQGRRNVDFALGAARIRVAR